MSTQGGKNVPVTILPESERQRVRLLELPPELLALLTSENPPRLQLKSREDLGGTGKDVNTVLCTPDKTYNIRQVSTSNSVFLTQPRDIVDENGGIPKTSIQAIAKCDSTLELIAAPKQSALPYMKSAVPVYSSTGNYGTSKVKSKAELFSHIPLSKGECEQAWTELACFESTDPVGCFIPHAKVRSQIWETAFTSAVADGADIQDPFIAGDVPAFALDLREDWPLEVLAALFASLATSSPGGNLAIDEEKCLHAVGLNLLEAQSGGKAISKSGFMQAWQDVVPESWRDKCNLALLQHAILQQDPPDTIIFVESESATAAKQDNQLDAKATLGAKRKWHEKFRPQKKTT